MQERRIYVLGPSACGKTRLAQKISEKLGVDYFSLDDIYLNTTIRQGLFNQVLRSSDYVDKKVDIITSSSRGWVVDGVYENKKLLDACDTVVVIFLPLYLSLYYQWKRTVTTPEHRRIFPLTNDMVLSTTIVRQRFPHLSEFEFDGVNYKTIRGYKETVDIERGKGKRCYVVKDFNYDILLNEIIS